MRAHSDDLVTANMEKSVNILQTSKFCRDVLKRSFSFDQKSMGLLNQKVSVSDGDEPDHPDVNKLPVNEILGQCADGGTHLWRSQAYREDLIARGSARQSSATDFSCLATIRPPLTKVSINRGEKMTGMADKGTQIIVNPSSATINENSVGSVAGSNEDDGVDPVDDTITSPLLHDKEKS